MKPFGAPQVTGRAVPRDPIVQKAPMGMGARGRHRTGPRGPMSALMAAILVVSLLPWAPAIPSQGANGSFGGGDGSVGNPYIIEDVWDLQNMSGDLTAHYALGGDIDASDTANWNSGEGFVPVGGQFIPFSGSLDGRGHAISDLSIDRDLTNSIGLFGRIGTEGTVDGVTMTLGNVTGWKNVGMLVGYNEGTLTHCNLTGKVRGTSYIGGLVGYNTGTLTSCHIIGSVHAASDRVGGLVGHNLGTLADCSAAGNVGTSVEAGGLAGYNNGTVSNSHSEVRVVGQNSAGGLIGIDESGWLSGCHATGDTDGLRSVGGLIGRKEGGTVVHSYATGKVYGRYESVGGLIGAALGASISDSYATGDVTAAGPAGGLVGRIESGSVNGSYATGKVDGSEDFIGGFVGTNEGGSLSNISAIGRVHGRNGVGGLVGHSSHGSVSGSHAHGDVDGFSSVGGLIGSSSYSILTDSYATGNSSGVRLIAGGLVGVDSLGVISNCSAEGSVKGESRVGGLLGQGSTTVSDSCSTGNVTGTGDSIGGLIGFFRDEGSVSNSHYDVGTVLINGGHYITIGGLLHSQYLDWRANGRALDISAYSGTLVPSDGHFEISTVQGLEDLLGFADVPEYGFRLAADLDLSASPGLYVPYLATTFDGDNHTVSGLDLDLPFVHSLGMVGVNAGGTVSNVMLVDATVSSGFYSGRLVGLNHYGTVANSTAAGTVAGTHAAGGLAGRNYRGVVTQSSAIGNSTGAANAGGLVGYNEAGDVASCLAKGRVSGAEAAGGLVGYNHGGRISDSYSMARVEGPRFVGGFVGDTYMGAVSRSYSAGAVSGTGTVGGFAGRVNGTQIDGFWDTEASGQGSSGGGSGRTTAKMMSQGTFVDAGWDFEGVWCILENVTYPLLRWQDRTAPTAEAGEDRSIVMGTTTILDGSGSSDDLLMAAFKWTLQDGGTVVLDGAHQTYLFARPGVYAVVLEVTDVVGRHGEDTVVIRVLDVTPPVAVAGKDAEVPQGTTLALDGSASTDNWLVEHWLWTITSPDGPVFHYDTPYANHTFEQAGVHVVTLRVYDPSFNWGEASFNVTVIDVTPPIAVAGIDAAVDQLAPLPLDGSGSTDNVGVVSWVWTILDADGPHYLMARKTSYAFPLPGRFQVSLTVSDAAGNSDVAYKNVTVVDITPPVVDIPASRTVDLDGVLAFDIGNSTDDGGPVSLWWVGVGDAGIQSVGNDTYRFTRLGTFPIWLTVRDSNGNEATAVVMVTVVDREPPRADAGPDVVAIEDTVVTLDGSGSADNAGIASYVWRCDLSGFTTTGQRVEWKAPGPGTFVVTLIVTDASNNSAEDEVNVTFLSRNLYLWLGPFLDADGRPVDDVDVRVTFNGTTYRQRTNSSGWITVQVLRAVLIHNATVVATKPSWERLEFKEAFDTDGRALSDVPPMKREPTIPMGRSLLPWAALAVAAAVVAILLLHRSRKGAAGPDRER